MQKLFSHKRFLVTRSSKLDHMLVCSNNFFFGSKVTTLGLHKLPHLFYASYRAIFTKVTRVMFFNKYFSLVKVTVVFVVSYWVKSYHPWGMQLIVLVWHKLQGVCFSTTIFSPLVKVTAVFVRKLSSMWFIYYCAIFT